MFFLNYWKVAAKDSLKLGDRIFLPITIQEFPTEKQDCPCTDEELNYIRSLELYKVLMFNSSMVLCVFLCHLNHTTLYGFTNSGFSHYCCQQTSWDACSGKLTNVGLYFFFPQTSIFSAIMIVICLIFML